MRNALRTRAWHGARDRIERHHRPGVALEVDHVQPVGVLLKFGQHFQQHAVLVIGGVDGGGELRAEGVVEGAGDGLPVEVQGGGAVAVEDDIDARRLNLEVAGHLLQSGHSRDNAL